ncbi:MAG TPA: hypothetical protein VHV31_16785 [Nitrolancea sp.]|nr:hypothetical protein [Nitrolancea sp.]
MRLDEQLTADEQAQGTAIRIAFEEIALTPAQRRRHLERLEQRGRSPRMTVSIDSHHLAWSSRAKDIVARRVSPPTAATSTHHTRLKRTFEGAALVLIVLLFAIGALLARSLMPGQYSSPASGLANAPTLTTVYAVQQLASGAQLLPLDPITLADQPGGSRTPPSGYWAVSPDGSTVVTFEYQQGSGEIVVSDGFGENERSHFASPIPGIVGTIELSNDGSRLLGNLRLQSSRWFVIDTRSGKLLMSLDTKSPSLTLDTPMHTDDLHLSPDGSRLYRFVYTDRSDAGGPQALRIIEYDVTTGKQLVTMTYNSILVGSWQSTLPGEPGPVSNFLGPGIAFSPNGQTIAVVQPDGSAVDLLDARKLTTERIIPLSRPTSFLERALVDLGLAPRRAAAKTMGGSLHFAAFSSDGQALYTWGDTISVDSASGMQGLGFTRIDLTNGATKQVLSGELIQQVQPSPDGTSLYVTGYLPTVDATVAQSSIWRLDPRSLQTLAERSLSDVYSFALVSQR